MYTDKEQGTKTNDPVRNSDKDSKSYNEAKGKRETKHTKGRQEIETGKGQK